MGEASRSSIKPKRDVVLRALPVGEPIDPTAGGQARGDEEESSRLSDVVDCIPAAPVPLPADSPAVPPGVFVRPSVARPADWDRFAQACHASFRCAYFAARAWQFEHHLLQRLRRFDFFVDTPGGQTKVGQCAVGVGRRQTVFSDTLHLLPGYDDHWPAAMAALLERLGPGQYDYGSEWTLDPPRETQLAALAGVAVNAVASTSVLAIDLRGWATFEDYLKAVSTNVRRNVKKAEKSYGTLDLVVKRGLAPIPYFLKSINLRRTLFRRKRLANSTARMVVRSVARLACLKKYSRTAYLVADGAVLASYVGVNFGPTFSYLEGASDPAGKGTAWHLLVAMIRQAFDDSAGRGRFIMGSDDGAQAGVEAWEGLRRSREQCCATAFPTSVVHFTFTPRMR